MKLILAFVAVTLLELSTAVKIFSDHDFWWNKKYPLHCEPNFERSSNYQEEIIETKWIEQKLNNFDVQDRRTFKMRYMENNFYQQEGGPIFIFVGGEWTISEGTLRGGHTYDMTRQLNGTLFYTEHRYYGQTRPTPDLVNDNLRFLNIDQALADLAHFIVHVKQTNPALRNSGVILVGCSYAATMVTWFIQKYPHLANGAWSSSAPLEAKVDFVEYKQTVSHAMELVGGPNCTRRIENAFKELETLAAEGNSTRIRDVFRLCYPFDLNNDLDVWSFFSSVASPFSGMVQYYREEFQQIEGECEIIVNQPNPNDLEALAHWWWFGDEVVDPEEPFDWCYDHRYLRSLQNYIGTDWGSWAAVTETRQWYYQTCSEYGWYQSSGLNDTIFGSSFPVDLSLQFCHDLYFGLFSPEDVHRNVDRTNVIYGATNPRVKNVYSTHGEIDPWRPMGVQEDINESSPTVILPRESHCSDLNSIQLNERPHLRASKERIFQLVQEWLGLTV